MRGEQYLRKPAQFKLVYAKGTSRADKLLVLKAVPNKLDLTRYGLSISRQVGGAVIRNRVKRRLREIVRATSLSPGWDIVVIVRVAAAEAEYREIKCSLEKLLGRSGILRTEKEGPEIKHQDTGKILNETPGIKGN